MGRPDFVYPSFVCSSSVDGHLGRLHLLTIMNSAAVNNLCTSFWMNIFSVFSSSDLGGELLGHTVTLYLTVWGTARLPSEVAAPFYLRYSSV